MHELARFLEDADERVRDGAVRAMGRVRDSRARVLLEAHVTSEPSLDVRMATEEAIAAVKAWEAREEARRESELLGLPAADLDPEAVEGIMDR
jgi:HEAT repeat protein